MDYLSLLKEVPVIESKKGNEILEQTKRAAAAGQNVTNSPGAHGGAPVPGTTSSAMAAAAGAAATTATSATIASASAQGGAGGGAAGAQGAAQTAASQANVAQPPQPVIAPPKAGDLTSLISVGLIGALNTNGGMSNTSALASTLFASGASTEESNFNKRLLSRFGCYLIITVVKPEEIGSLVD